MQPEDRIRLRHLREAAGKALTYSDGKQRSDLDDELLRLALTKLVEIVGEAAKSISPDGRAAIPDVPWRAAARMRKMHSSVGPKYQSVWHRSPDGEWTMWSDVDPSQSCQRYWGNDLQRAIRAPIDIAWPGPSLMTVKIDNGRDLDWEVQLGSTLVTRALSAVGRLTPNALWQRPAVLSAMGAVAGPMLGAGRMPRSRIPASSIWSSGQSSSGTP